MVPPPDNDPGNRTASGAAVADAAPGNWVDALAPRRFRPYLRLARLDRPIGAWLLLWPAWWSAALAAREAPVGWRWAVTGAGANAEGVPDPILLVLLLVGAFAMRGAGCIYNDIVDRDLDAQVARTASRPIPSGQVGVGSAVLFAALVSVVGLAVLLTFNRFAILLGAASLLLVALYPFAKRFTHWPQLVLGLAFNWGALLGWAALAGELSWAPLALYVGGIAWTLGYDTIYAHMDKAGDLAAGVKSSAIALGARTKPAVAAFYGVALAGIAAAAWLAGVAFAPFLAVLAAAGAQLAWQVVDLDIDDPANCLSKFRSNHLFGMLVFAAIIAGHLFAAQVLGATGGTNAVFIPA